MRENILVNYLLQPQGLSISSSQHIVLHSIENLLSIVVKVLTMRFFFFVIICQILAVLHVTTALSTITTTALQTASKTIIVTGSSSGIGLAAVKQLLESRPQYKIILANRSKEKTLKAFEYLPSQYKTRTQFEELDLADLSSIRAFAQRWGNEPIDCLALNAGLSFAKGQSPAYTKEGYELTVGTNHLGHFLLLNLLLPNVAKSPEGRIVFTASSVHNPEERGGDVGLPAGLKDMKGLKSNLKAPNNMIDGSEYDPDKAYKDSKLCNVLTCLELNQRLKQDPKYSHVTANCFNPGLVPTSGLFRYQNPFFSGIFSFLMRNVFKLAVSEEKAGSRLVYMIDSADLRGKTGRYFTAKASDDQLYEVTPSREAQDVNKAKQLWQISEGLVGL